MCIGIQDKEVGLTGFKADDGGKTVSVAGEERVEVLLGGAPLYFC